MNEKIRRKEERAALIEEYAHLGYLGKVISRDGAFGLVVRGVAQMEELLDAALSKHEKWSIARDLARTVDDKIRLAFALGVINEEIFLVMRSLNRFRNEVSHEWNAIVDEERVKVFMTSLPPRVVRFNQETIAMVEKTAEGMGHKLPEPWLDELTMVVAQVVVTKEGQWIITHQEEGH